MLLATALIACGTVIGVSAPLSDSGAKVAAAVETRDDNARALGGTTRADYTVSPEILVDDPEIAARLAQTRENVDGSLTRRLDTVTPLGALQFPAGLTYPEAVTQLYMAIAARKAPRGANLVGSLPAGKVAVVPSESAGSVVLDLRAPFGYEPGTPGRWILPASIAFDEGLSPEEISNTPRSEFGWPRGGLVGVAILPLCMRLSSRDDVTSPPCSPGDIAVQDLRLLRGPSLP